MAEMAASFAPEQLEERACEFCTVSRPAVSRARNGRGRKGDLNLGTIHPVVGAQ